VASLTTFQQDALDIYNRLNEAITNPAISQDQVEQFQNYRNGFLQIPSFGNALITGAQASDANYGASFFDGIITDLQTSNAAPREGEYIEQARSVAMQLSQGIRDESLISTFGLSEENDLSPGNNPVTSPEQTAQASTGSQGRNQTRATRAEQIADAPTQASAGSNGRNQTREQAEEAPEATQTVESRPPEDIVSEMSREELITALRNAPENGGGDYGSYKAAIIQLEPEGYTKFFEGLESHEPYIQELFVDALNNPDSTVMDRIIDYADDPASLEAMTVMVTDDNSSFYHVADTRQMSDFINTLSRENGNDVHSTNAHEGTAVPEVLDNGQVVAPDVQEFGPMVQDQLDIMMNAPQVVVPEGTALPDNIPESYITEVRPDGTLIAPTPDDRFDAPTAPEATSEAIDLSTTADVRVLFNGAAGDDIGYLEDLIQEAKDLGVDVSAIDAIEAEIDSDKSQFVTTQTAAVATIAYNEQLQDAISNDGFLAADEYKGILSNYFTNLSEGVVENTADLDDISATQDQTVAAEAAINTVSALRM